MKTMDILFPVNEGRITHGFDEDRNGKPHGGYDIVGAKFPAYSLACCDSIVKVAGWSDSFGYRVWLEPIDKETKKRYPFFVYGHHRVLKVLNGQRIKRGDIIGELGNTGMSKGVHLHFGAADAMGLSRKAIKIKELE